MESAFTEAFAFNIIRTIILFDREELEMLAKGS